MTYIQNVCYIVYIKEKGEIYMKKSFYPVLMCNKIQEEANFFTDLRVRLRKSENRIFCGEKYNFYQMKDICRRADIFYRRLRVRPRRRQKSG